MGDAAGRKIPILIVTDCEPDARETRPGEGQPWTGFERFFDVLAAWRGVIAQRTGASAHFAWLWRLDPQIAVTYGDAGWPARTYAHQITEMRRHGDETGCHTHVWRWDDALKRWIADFGDEAWVERCIRAALAEYERAFGAPCRLFSFGDAWLDQPATRLLERLGIAIDMTLEPGRAGGAPVTPDELSTGLMPDQRAIPPRPYRPSRSDFRKPDDARRDGLWLMPMTTGPAVYRHPSAPDKVVSLTAVEKLNLGFEPERFMPIFERAITNGARPHAAIAVRTDVGSDEGLLRYVASNIASMLEHPLAGRFAFVTPSEALRLLTG